MIAIMNRCFIIFALLLMANVCTAQKYTVRNRGLENKADSVVFVEQVQQVKFDELMRSAGRYQRKSANFRSVAIGATAAGGILVAVGNKRKELVGVGIGVMSVGVVCELISINYQFKSGVALEASANSIKIKF